MPVAKQLDTEGGLTDGKLPTKLAQAVVRRARDMAMLEVVQALEKCQGMAVKLQAAKFLQKAGGKQSIEEMRDYARRLIDGTLSEPKEVPHEIETDDRTDA